MDTITTESAIDAKVDALLASGSELQTAPAEPAQPQQSAPSTPPAGGSATPEGVAPEAPKDPATATAQAPEGDEEPEPAVTAAEPEEYTAGEMPDVPGMTPTRWERYQGGYKFSKALVQAFNPGVEVKSLDPTLLPSVDEVVQYRDGFLKQARLEESFLSGNPQHAQAFVQHWNQSSPEAMAVVADQFQNVLAQSNPQAYQRMAVPVLNRFLDGMYAAAHSATDPEARRSLATAAQIAEYHLTGGRYRQFDAEKAPDPLSERERLINQRWEQLQQHQQQSEQQASLQWQQSVDNEITAKALEAEVDAKLEPLKAAYKNAPKVFEALRSNLLNDVRQSANSNPQIGIWQIKYDRALNSRGNQALLNDVVSQYKSMVVRAIAANLPAYFRNATANVTAQAAQRTQQLQQAASKTDVAASAAPVQQPLTPNLNQIKTLDGKIDALLAGGIR